MYTIVVYNIYSVNMEFYLNFLKQSPTLFEARTIENIEINKELKNKDFKK